MEKRAKHRYESENLEKIIANNLESFSKGELPKGHKERFMSRLEALESKGEAAERVEGRGLWQRLKLWGSQMMNNPAYGRKSYWIITPALCALAALLLVYNLYLKPNAVLDMERQYIDEVQTFGHQLMSKEESFGEGNEADLLYSISSIMEEGSTPLTLQLPENLSKKEQQRIIKEYYNQKMEGLKKIEIFLAQNSNDE